jgi:hypothetical protein
MALKMIEDAEKDGRLKPEEPSLKELQEIQEWDWLLLRSSKDTNVFL